MEYLVELGINIDKVHEILSYNQKPWMKTCRELNTEKRKKAKNEFEKDFYKVINNAVFGKTMENVKNRVNLRLVADHAKAVKLFASIYIKECSYKKTMGCT